MFQVMFNYRKSGIMFQVKADSQRQHGSNLEQKNRSKFKIVARY